MKMYVEFMLKIIGISMAVIGGMFLIIAYNSSSLTVSESTLVQLWMITCFSVVVTLIGYLLHFIRWSDDRRYESGIKIKPMDRR